MNVRRILPFIFSLLLACAVFLPAAHADAWNQMTRLTFSQPVEIPGAVLPAGTYWFVLADGPADRNIVQIFSSDWSQVYATLLTVPATRAHATARTEIDYAERPHHEAPALYQWYYPGRFTGHEFLYPVKERQMLAREVKQEVLAKPVTMAANITPALP